MVGILAETTGTAFALVRKRGNVLTFAEKTHVMTATTARIILSVDKKKEKAFLEMLKLFDFVKVENKEELLRRFIKNAPKDVPLTTEEVAMEVMEHRYGKKRLGHAGHF